MWLILVGAFLYLVFRKKIKKWLRLNEEFVEKWKDNPEIMDAYDALKIAFEAAGLDRKWTVTEIIIVLGLAIRLFSLVKKYEEEENK